MKEQNLGKIIWSEPFILSSLHYGRGYHAVVIYSTYRAVTWMNIPNSKENRPVNIIQGQIVVHFQCVMFYFIIFCGLWDKDWKKGRFQSLIITKAVLKILEKLKCLSSNSWMPQNIRHSAVWEICSREGKQELTVCQDRNLSFGHLLFEMFLLIPFLQFEYMKRATSHFSCSLHSSVATRKQDRFWAVAGICLFFIWKAFLEGVR